MSHTTENCGWCCKPINSYQKKSTVSETLDHYEWMKNFITEKLNLNEGTPPVFKIISYLFSFDDVHLCGKPCYLFEILSMEHYNCHFACLRISASKTKSGRKTERGKLLCNANFVPGSGISGCDRFDMGYDDGVFYDKEKFIPDYLSTSSFVVPDELLLPTDCDSEEEISESYSSSEDESDFDEDREWD